jgi:hypothetical protein
MLIAHNVMSLGFLDNRKKQTPTYSVVLEGPLYLEQYFFFTSKPDEVMRSRESTYCALQSEELKVANLFNIDLLSISLPLILKSLFLRALVSLW